MGLVDCDALRFGDIAGREDGTEGSTHVPTS